MKTSIPRVERHRCSALNETHSEIAQKGCPISASATAFPQQKDTATGQQARRS